MKKEFKETNMELVNEEKVGEVTTEKKNLWTKVKETGTKVKEKVVKHKKAIIAVVAVAALGFAIKHLIEEDDNEEIEINKIEWTSDNGDVVDTTYLF